MMESMKEIDFTDFSEALPAFFTIVMMPFSYSIANGIAAGIIFYPIMKVFTGKYKDVNVILYILAIVFILRFILLPQSDCIGQLAIDIIYFTENISDKLFQLRYNAIMLFIVISQYVHET